MLVLDRWCLRWQLNKKLHTIFVPQTSPPLVKHYCLKGNNNCNNDGIVKSLRIILCIESRLSWINKIFFDFFQLLLTIYYVIFPSRNLINEKKTMHFRFLCHMCVCVLRACRLRVLLFTSVWWVCSALTVHYLFSSNCKVVHCLQYCNGEIITCEPPYTYLEGEEIHCKLLDFNEN